MNEPQSKIEPLDLPAVALTTPDMVYESPELSKLYGALAKAQGEMDTAKEDAVNPFFKNTYANFESIVKCSRPYLVKQGLAVIQRVMPPMTDGRNYLSTRLCHESGQWIESKMLLLPTKADMQGMGSAITYAKRYAYAALIGVTTGEEDDDGNAACGREKKTKKSVSIATITQVQAKNILELVMKFKDENLLDKILSFYKISKLSDLPQSLYEDCLGNIKKKGEKQ